MIGYVYSLWTGKFVCKTCEVDVGKPLRDGTLIAHHVNKPG